MPLQLEISLDPIQFPDGSIHHKITLVNKIFPSIKEIARFLRVSIASIKLFLKTNKGLGFNKVFKPSLDIHAASGFEDDTAQTPTSTYDSIFDHEEIGEEPHDSIPSNMVEKYGIEPSDELRYPVGFFKRLEKDLFYMTDIPSESLEMAEYPKQFILDAVAYADENTDAEAALQYGVPVVTIKGWRIKFAMQSNENSEQQKNDNHGFDQELSKWILKQMDEDQRPTLENIAVEAVKIARQVGRSDIRRRSGSWSRQFLKKMELLSKWQNLKPTAVNYRKQELATLISDTLTMYEEAEVDPDPKSQFEQEVSKWILRRLKTNARPTLIEIAKKAVGIATDVGRSNTFTPTGSWSSAFMKKMGLLYIWRRCLNDLSYNTSSASSSQQASKQQLDIHLRKWVSKRLQGGDRPTVMRISRKGLEIARQIGAKSFTPSKVWGYSFLLRTRLKQQWRGLLLEEKKALRTSVQKTLPAPSKHWQADEKTLMEKAEEYAEMYGNKLAVEKFGIPEKTFYLYLMQPVPQAEVFSPITDMH